MSNDKLTDDVSKRFDDTDTENNNDGDSSHDINLDKQLIASSLHNENGAAKRNKRDQTCSSTSDEDVPGYTDFAISGKQKELGILCIARENNIIVVKVRKEESGEDPFVIRRAINFKDWNIFIRDLRKNIFDDLRYEIPDPKHLNRTIAYAETV